MKPLLAAVAVAVPLFAACASDTVEPGAPADAGPEAGALADAAAPGPHPRPLPPASHPPPTGKPPQDPACDLNGRWLVAQRELATAIGQDQVAHNWFYYEIRHEGADVVVTRGLHCGY